MVAKREIPARAAVEGTTRVVGILGNPVEHSLSPRMHNAAYAALGLDFVYVPFRATPSTIRQAVRAMRTLGIVGFNVTVPYKQDILRLVDRRTPAAAAIGAVNTIWRDGDEVVGDNTDATGFVEALRSHGSRIRGARVLVIGAGGSARAVLHALREGGAADIVLANRTPATARQLAREFGAPAAGAKRSPAKSPLVRPSGLAALADHELLATRTLVVNCTPVGLKGGDFLDYAAAATPKACVHFDLAYTRGLTPFLTLAHRKGRPTIDGRHMLVHQGAAAFRLFTGKKAPVAVMLVAVGVQPGRGKP
ncbi:MAG: shikimate dehydrogenase [Candidatus Binatia bacterium]